MRRLVPACQVFSLPPTWEAAQGSWQTCLEFFRRGGCTDDEAHALAMVANELLENAVKYGAWRSAPPPHAVELSLEVDARSVTIEVRSPIAEDETALKALDNMIQWIRGFQSPFEAYVERLKHVSARAYREDESGLGLARVAHEARCLLDFYVTTEQQLAMSAVYRPGGLY